MRRLQEHPRKRRILGGLAVRRVALEHRSAGELLGPGDLLRPWESHAHGDHIAYPFSAALRVLEPLSLESWGRVRPDGVYLRLRLTHEVLGFLVGARRPSVTAALGRLASQELVRPHPDGGWLLLGAPPERLRPQPRRR